MFDVTKSTNEVFSWQRHYETSIDAQIRTIKSLVASNCLKEVSVFNKTDYWKDKVVLDAGCGGGTKANAYAQCKAKISIGIDGSKLALSAAEIVSEKLGNKNTIFREGFLENLLDILGKEDIDRVDHITCAQVIHHCEGWKDIIRQFSDCLSDGGVLQIIWCDPSLGISRGESGLLFLIKNKIAFHLGKTPKSRTEIGKKLFRRWDEKLRQRWDVEDDSFYADRYAAFYRVITLSSMLKVLRDNNFRVVESYPPISAEEFVKQVSCDPKNRIKAFPMMRYLINHGLILGAVATLLVRLEQFFRTGGTERHLICIKTNDHTA